MSCRWRLLHPMTWRGWQRCCRGCWGHSTMSLQCFNPCHDCIQEVTEGVNRLDLRWCGWWCRHDGCCCYCCSWRSGTERVDCEKIESLSTTTQLVFDKGDVVFFLFWANASLVDRSAFKNLGGWTHIQRLKISQFSRIFLRYTRERGLAVTPIMYVYWRKCQRSTFKNVFLNHGLFFDSKIRARRRVSVRHTEYSNITINNSFRHMSTPPPYLSISTDPCQLNSTWDLFILLS